MNSSLLARPVLVLSLVLGLLLAPASVAAGSTVDATATPSDPLGNTIDSTTDTLNDTVDSTTTTLENTVTDTPSTVEGTVDDTTTTLEDTVNDTTNTVDDTTDAVNDTVDNTTDAVDDTTGGATENLTGTVDDTTEKLTGTVDGTTSLTTEELSATSQFLLESATRDLGLVLGGTSSTLFASDYNSSVQTLAASDAEGFGMTSTGPVEDPSKFRVSDDKNDDGAASIEPGSDGSGVPIPNVPPEGLAAGALGLAAVGAALVRQGSLSAGPVGSTAAAAKYSAMDRLPRLFAPFRYSRFDDSDPLEHEARVEMLDAVEAAPGTYLSEMAEQADLPLSTARHHVRVLEREGLIASAKVRGRRRFYPGDTEGLELAAAMNDQATATILDALARLGPSSVSGLAETIDRDPSTVTHHLKRLSEDDIIVRERDGRAMVNRLSPEAAEALGPGLATDETEEPVDAVVSAD